MIMHVNWTAEYIARFLRVFALHVQCFFLTALRPAIYTIRAICGLSEPLEEMILRELV